MPKTIDGLTRQQRWTQKNPDYWRLLGNARKKTPKSKAKAAEYGKRPDVKARAQQARIELKLQVLSHYGKNEKLECCWPDCGVTDLDLLTLDHQNNDGAKDRKQGNLYRRVRNAGFPTGFQTLCWNHQWKKQMIRLRGEK
jgi:hypothetical protein